MGMFEYKKTLSAIDKAHNSVGKGKFSVQAMQVMLELELFGSSSLLATEDMSEYALSELLSDKGVRELMYRNHEVLSYFLKVCVDMKRLYIFMRHALDILDTPTTIKTLHNLVSDVTYNCKFFDAMVERAKDVFSAIVVNNLSWFPYSDRLVLSRSSDTAFTSSSSRIPSPARGFLQTIGFYKCTDGNMNNAVLANEDFKALGITVTVVIDFGYGEPIEVIVGDEGVSLEDAFLNETIFRGIDKDVIVSIKEPVYANYLYEECNLFVGVTYKRVSRGEFE